MSHIALALLILHMFRTHFYQYTSPRMAYSGMCLFLLALITCFTGYALAAGQMSL